MKTKERTFWDLSTTFNIILQSFLSLLPAAGMLLLLLRCSSRKKVILDQGKQGGFRGQVRGLEVEQKPQRILFLLGLFRASLYFNPLFLIHFGTNSLPNLLNIHQSSFFFFSDPSSISFSLFLSEFSLFFAADGVDRLLGDFRRGRITKGGKQGQRKGGEILWVKVP